MDARVKLDQDMVTLMSSPISSAVAKVAVMVVMVAWV
jgi:hypothetical protein